MLCFTEGDEEVCTSQLGNGLLGPELRALLSKPIFRLKLEMRAGLHFLNGLGHSEDMKAASIQSKKQYHGMKKRSQRREATWNK